MKKALILLLLFLASIGIGFSNETLDSDTLKIAGFKVGADEYFNVVIVDALSESLDTVADGGEIILDRHKDELITPIAEIVNGNSQLVFSYRVSGNKPGDFKISLTFEPFIGENDTSNFIKTYYELANFNFLSFSADNTCTWDESIAPVTVDKAGESKTMTQNFHVSFNNPEILSEWIFRGGVLMAISGLQYPDAKTDTYRANVIVKLESV